MNSKLLATCCLMPLCGMIGCATIILSPEVVLTQPEQNKVPIKVGYYVVKKTLTLPPGVTMSDVSIQQGVQAVARNAFEDIIEISSSDINTRPKDIPLILVADIVGLMVCFKVNEGEDRAGFKIKWTIIDAQDKILWMDTVLGEATDNTHNCRLHSCARERAKRLMERAILVQFQNARESILRYKWWE